MSGVSHTNTQQRTASLTGHAGLPAWSGIAILAAALVTGALLSYNSLQLSTLYLVCFAVAAVVVAVFTQARGIFLLAASVPTVFAVVTVGASWLFGRAQAPNLAPFSTTSILASIYPFIQFFPTLFWVSLGVAVIGGLRVWLLQRNLSRHNAVQARARMEASQADRENQQAAARARSVTRAAQAAQTIDERTLTPEERRRRAAERRRARAQQQVTATPTTDARGETREFPRLATANTAHSDGDATTSGQRTGEESAPDKPRQRRSRAYDEANRAPGQITVEELLARNKKKAERRRRRSRRLHSDLYGED
ncbi:gamma-aminobutyrate permease or related permease [Corynebacterium renale]|nr:gamma-aminobutyrate permease or related permease [Corynebacterium renale]STC95146.1 gamma-aminobutyrate permease or related permease [Corynebacterium renale]